MSTRSSSRAACVSSLPRSGTAQSIARLACRDARSVDPRRPGLGAHGGTGGDPPRGRVSRRRSRRTCSPRPRRRRAPRRASASGSRSRSSRSIPPGARDLDQALHIERRGDGHRVSLRDRRRRRVRRARRRARPRDARARRDGLRARRQGAAASAGAVRGRREPAAGRVAPGGGVDARPRRGAASWCRPSVARAQVRSVAQHTYEDVPPALAPLLREVGERRLALERERGGVRLAVPEQEVVQDGDGWTVRYRVPLASEEHNAQISLLTGMAAAALMLRGGLRRSCARSPRRTSARSRGCAGRPRRSASTGPRAAPTPSSSARLDPARPDPRRPPARGDRRRVAAPATRAFDGAPPAEREHFAIAAPYAHATAPLRRLQDRYVSECCLAASRGNDAAGLGARGARGAAGRDVGGDAPRERGRARRRRPRRGGPARRAARASASTPWSSTKGSCSCATRPCEAA